MDSYLMLDAERYIHKYGPYHVSSAHSDDDVDMPPIWSASPLATGFDNVVGLGGTADEAVRAAALICVKRVLDEA